MFGHSVDVKDVVEQLVRAIVRYPEEVTVKALRGERSVLIEIQVAKEDAGVVIGREGHTIQAIRHLAHVVGARQGQRTQVVLLDPASQDRRHG